MRTRPSDSRHIVNGVATDGQTADDNKITRLLEISSTVVHQT